MTPTQSNTQAGLLKFIANADLTGKEGYLAKLVDATGVAKIALAGDGEFAQFVITEGAASGESVEVQPLDPSRNVRVISGATIQGGVKVAADSNGKLAAATAGEHVIGVLEQDVVSGQLGRIRPQALGIHHAATQVTMTTGAALGAFTDPPSAGEMAALRTQINAMRVDLLAIKTVLDEQKITAA